MDKRGGLLIHCVAFGVLGFPSLSAQTIFQTPLTKDLITEPSAVSASSLAQPLPSDSAPAELPASASPVPATISSAITRKLPVKSMFIQEVDVLAKDSKPVIQPDEGVSLKVESRDVSQTAGAYNDIPKFLQTLPGVIFDTDARNTYLVNGGNDMENLYVLNGVEIPNINHISTAGSSGGFVSIIDTDAVSSLTLHNQLYGSEYSGTLSSVLDIHTLIPEANQRHGELSMGYAGAGFVMEVPMGNRVETMTQFRRSIVNYFTNDIGIDGVPKYTSLLSTAIVALNSKDSIRTLFLFANDSLDIKPNTLDIDDPGLVNTNYQGQRSTGAVTWHHDISTGSNDLQLNYSSVTTSTLQTNPYQIGASVYNDRLSETPVTLRYDLYRQYNRFNFQAGSTGSLNALNYKIDQASGYPSPYSIDPTPVDASNISVSMFPKNYAAYGQSAVTLFGPVQIMGGIRYEHWGINDSSAWMPRAEMKIQLDSRLFAFGGVASYSQMPSLPIMLGVTQNISLKPIKDLQTDAGLEFVDIAGDQFGASAYTRTYTNYPVSTEFHSLSLADIVDPFGLPHLYMPMTSAGTGYVSGFKMHMATSSRRRAFLQASLTSQVVTHKALDGVSRPASYDMPTITNVSGGIRIGRRQIITGRYSYHTGTPYTPFLLNESEQQGREIYDLSQINTQRGGNYDRVDLRYEVSIPIRDRSLKVYVGMENLLNRNNYYQYVLLPQCHSCGPYELTQMGRYPDGGAVWTF